MKDYDEKEWILEHLKICGYQVEEITYLKSEDFEKNLENLFSVKLRLFDELVECLVFQHGECLDMISKHIQVKDMLGKSDDIIFPRSNGEKVILAKRNPIMPENDIPPNTVLFYEDYVLLREHFFKGKHLLQVVCWVRTDDPNLYLDYGNYGHYTMTIITGLNEAV